MPFAGRLAPRPIAHTQGPPSSRAPDVCTWPRTRPRSELLICIRILKNLTKPSPKTRGVDGLGAGCR